MQKFILGLGLFFLGTYTYAQGLGLDSIIVEKYYVSNAADSVGGGGNGTGTLPIGSVTYRVFADLAPGYAFQAMYGEYAPGTATPLHTLIINTSTKFFNNTDRGDTSPNGIASTQLKNNTVALDSWFSVGAAAAGQMGVLKSEDDGVTNLISANTKLKNAPASIGIPLSTQDGMIAGSPQAVTFVGLPTETEVFNATSQLGSSFSTSNGSIASLSGSVGPTVKNRVLLGQFTTNGIFHFELNIQIGLATGGGTEKHVANNPVAGEFTAASLTYTSPAPTTVTNIAPTVSITAPATAATYTTGAVVAITAAPADTDGSIDSVEFFVDGLKIGVAVSSPYTSTVVSTAGTHTLTAIATDNGGASKTSAPITIVVSGTVTGIQDISVSGPSLMIYPNPAKDLVTLEINATKQSAASYSIYDVKGILISTKNIGTVTGKYLESIDISSYSEGQYVIYLSLDGVVTTKKLIKN